MEKESPAGLVRKMTLRGILLSEKLCRQNAKSGSFQLDVVEVNVLLKELGSGSEPAVPPASEGFSFDYTVLDQDENLIFSTEKDASSASLAEATKNRNSIRNIRI